MKKGLLAHLEENDNALMDWKDSTELRHLFGNERNEDERKRFQRGALAFRPTWFDKVGFEVINPHDRAKKAGAKALKHASDAAILDAMVADPILIERPLVETEKGVRLCRPPEKVRDIL